VEVLGGTDFMTPGRFVDPKLLDRGGYFEHRNFLICRTRRKASNPGGLGKLSLAQSARQ